jgi:predicted Fe-Mo cluster-binding NifX family protein
MRIAVATENGIVSSHFGHCSGFTIYDTEDGKVTSSNYVPNPGHEPGVLPVFLSNLNVEIVIAGGMGERAQTLFSQNNIDVIVGASGSADDAAASYLEGSLKSAGVFCSEHNH